MCVGPRVKGVCVSVCVCMCVHVWALGLRLRVCVRVHVGLPPRLVSEMVTLRPPASSKP